ncbi:FadR family transcriptional regulator [Paeniglutamicibacter sp. ABSL32-1]|uniref:FadR/GntR family transcriptional regulator n=1 Tax=Paeniglutamicibacter quisquiliarum TaxID=2849498 RepID=UPI001C2DE051|nr:FadR/GntR family transcriptional regulator [Paeniglutamicibacter quisquiliarum]MBV1781063.1 FadR family transcriptional regulator [Paeniglutamicibacter quisquiliarum]
MTLPDLVTALVEGIAHSAIAPGDKLPPERRLAELLGVGRSALREALKSLDLLGLIEIRQGDGTYLSASHSSMLTRAVGWGVFLNAEHTRQLVDARYFVEAGLARLAARNRKERDLDLLEESLARMRAATNSADFAEADTKFHFAIAQAADNTVLASVLESTRTLLTQWVVRVAAGLKDQGALIEQHQAIANAITEMDEEGAETAMRVHIAEVTRRLYEEIELPKR